MTYLRKKLSTLGKNLIMVIDLLLNGCFLFFFINKGGWLAMRKSLFFVSVFFSVY